MKRVVLFLLSVVATIQGMQPQEESKVREKSITILKRSVAAASKDIEATQKEIQEDFAIGDFAAAFRDSDIGKIKQIINEHKIDFNKPLKSGYTLLEEVLFTHDPHKLEVAGLMLDAGANKKQLARFLPIALFDSYFKPDALEEIKWLLNQGVEDKEGKAQTRIREMEEEAKRKATDAGKLPFEQAKKGPVKLTPLAKPVAKPAAAAQTAAPPVAAQPKSILRPLTKPAAALPINK